MIHLNYHHLRLFWAVANEGHLTRASRSLRLTPQTVSSQLKEFEATIGEQLFQRVGRHLVLTDRGQVVRQYADQIFSLGVELCETLSGQPSDRPLRLVVGVVEVLPKLVVHRLLEPAMQVDPSLRLICREGPPDRLLGALAIHELDVVLSDGPIPQTVNVHAFNHPLGSCGVTFMAQAALAQTLRKQFPASLNGAPVLLPDHGTTLRRELDHWFVSQQLRPKIVGEFADSALLKIFGQAGAGFFAVPTVVANEVVRQYEVQPLGATEDITETFYAISVERRVSHPAVMAICQAARAELFNVA